MLLLRYTKRRGRSIRAVNTYGQRVDRENGRVPLGGRRSAVRGRYPGIVDDGVHPSERVDLVGDTSGLNGAGKIADDHTSRPLREILERRRALAGSRMQDDLMSFVEERPAAARPKPSVLPVMKILAMG